MVDRVSHEDMEMLSTSRTRQRDSRLKGVIVDIAVGSKCSASGSPRCVLRCSKHNPKRLLLRLLDIVLELVTQSCYISSSSVCVIFLPCHDRFNARSGTELQEKSSERRSNKDAEPSAWRPSASLQFKEYALKPSFEA